MTLCALRETPSHKIRTLINSCLRGYDSGIQQSHNQLEPTGTVSDARPWWRKNSQPLLDTAAIEASEA